MKRKWLVGTLALLLLVAGGLSTSAGTTLKYYTESVGAYNGSAYTGSQTKTYSGKDGYLDSGYVYGSYVVDVRMNYGTRTGTASGAWVRNVTDNLGYLVSNGAGSGVATNLEFSNDLTTPRSVTVNGYWASN